MMTVVGDRGLDVAWDEPPSWQHAADVGYRFVIQYVSNDASKNADPEDIGAQRAAGIDGGYVWETTANRAAAGYDAGKADAVEAERQADALGIAVVNLDGTPVALYFATDFDATPGQVRAYYQGARDARTRRPVGCYGGIRVVDAMLTEGIVRYGWQTVAWSRDAKGVDQVSQIAHLYQRAARTLPDPGGSTDENICLKSDCGLWRATLALPQIPAAKTGYPHLNQPVSAVARTSSGKGYWLAAGDGGVFTYGDATFLGSLGDAHLNGPVIGIIASPSDKGYLLVGADGGVFNFGDAVFCGSLGDLHLNAPIVACIGMSSGAGYILVGADGGVFTFGDAVFEGSVPAAA